MKGATFGDRRVRSTDYRGGFTASTTMLKFLFPLDDDPPRPDTPVPPTLDARLVERHLGQLFAADGVVGCAVVDVACGLLLAEQARDGVELDAPAAACAEALRAHRDAAARLALPPVDEMAFTSGATLHLVRPLPRQPGLLLLVLVDRPRANLALARFRMAEAQRNLA
jgi:predicted regulator of Ras-like GTPase activity (Roadblock/LC7/MglB family)